MSDETLDSKDRRRLLLATGGVVGMGALAGCSGEEGGDGDDEGPTRPMPNNIDVDQLDPVLLFMVQSHHYQNKMLEREYGDG